MTLIKIKNFLSKENLESKLYENKVLTHNKFFGLFLYHSLNGIPLDFDADNYNEIDICINLLGFNFYKINLDDAKKINLGSKKLILNCSLLYKVVQIEDNYNIDDLFSKLDELYDYENFIYKKINIDEQLKFINKDFLI